jgi:type IV secretion system protein TrbL
MKTAWTTRGFGGESKRSIKILLILVWKRLLPALFLILFFASVSGAASAETSAEFADSMLQEFNHKFASYENQVWMAALTLFKFLFLCQFTWSALQLCLHESPTFATFVALLVRQTMTGMFFWWLLFDRSILRSIVSSFSELAGTGLSLSELIYIMENSVQKIMTAVGSPMTLKGITLFFSGLFASIIMSFALTTAIAYMTVIMIENYIVGSLGLILMGFGGSDYTRNYAVSYIHTLVHVGLKLFMASAIVQIGVLAFADATTGLNNLDTESISQICMRLIAQSFFFLAVTKVVPEVAGSLVSGVSATGMHTAAAIQAGAMSTTVSAAKAIYNTPGAVADAATGAARIGVSAVKKAANAYNANLDAYKSKGDSNFISHAFATTVGSMLRVGWNKYQASRGHQTGMQNSMDPPPRSGGTAAAASQSAPTTGKSDSVQSGAATNGTNTTEVTEFYD